MTVLRKYSTKQRDMDRARILHILLLNKTVATAILAKEPFAEEPGVEQDIAEIIKLVSRLSAPDLADVLEALPTEERLALWSLVSEERRGSVLVKASETVWSDLIEDMSDKALLNALRPLDFDDQIYLAQYLPRDLMGRFLPTLPQSARAQVRKSSTMISTVSALSWISRLLLFGLISRWQWFNAIYVSAEKFHKTPINSSSRNGITR